jgi:hypothetical protein
LDDKDFSFWEIATNCEFVNGTVEAEDSQKNAMDLKIDSMDQDVTDDAALTGFGATLLDKQKSNSTELDTKLETTESFQLGDHQDLIEI